MNKKQKLIRILIIILSVVLVSIFGFKIATEMKEKILKENLKDINWISDNVWIEEEETLGNKIYSIKKNKDIPIYNSYFQQVVTEKIDDFLEEREELIIYNPYGTNILSLNIYLNKDYKEVSYKVEVLDDDDVNNFERILKHNENNAYQLIGLVPGYQNKVTLTMIDQNDKEEIKEININMKDVSNNSQTKLTVTRGTSKQELSDGLYAILGNDSKKEDYVSLYDNDGIIRGEIPIIGYRAHNILFKDDKMYFSISQTKIAEVNNLGEVTNILRTGKYQLHHDYTFDKDGDLLVLANNTEKETEEDCIIKIDLETGKVEELIDFENMFKSYVETCSLDTESIRDEGEDGLDWLHLNSIEYVDGDVILSSRETSSIIKISDIEDEPKLEYILADKKIWENTEFSKYVYNKMGDFKIHAGQHSVRYTSGEDNMYYLTFYNNNYGKANSQPNFDYSTIGITNNKPFEGDESYYYVYKVNEDNKTFELVDSFDVEYSGIVSSVQKMANDNIIIDSGTKGIFAEYDNKHNLIKKFEVKLNSYMVYRVLKYDFNDFYFE